MKALLAFFLFTGAGVATAQGASSGSKHGSATWGGRYQLIQLSEFRRDQYLLDTDTGRVWVMVCAKSTKDGCESTVFDEVSVENLSKPKTSH